MRALAGCHSEPVAALLNSFIYSPDVLKGAIGENYIIRTIAAVASSLPSGRAGHALCYALAYQQGEATMRGGGGGIVAGMVIIIIIVFALRYLGIV